MSWKMRGHWYESCSCKMVCRCTLGPAEPDQGWCSAAQLHEIAAGDSDGVSLAGVRLCLAFQLPGDFFGGIEKARIYFDESTTPAQRQQLEAIFTGKRGGVWEPTAAMIGQWLPPVIAKIEVKVDGDNVATSVAGRGSLQLVFLKTADGAQAKLVNAPVVAAFGVDTVDLATATGTKWTDPDLRPWESLGFGGRVAYDWSA